MNKLVAWLRSDPEKYANVGVWAKDNGIHPGSIQKWGGRMLWNKLREDVRSEAMHRAIVDSPDVIAKDIAEQYQAKSRLTRLVTRLADRLEEDLDSEPEPSGDPKKDAMEKRNVSSFNTNMIQRLAEAIDKLADASCKMKGTAAQPGQPQVNTFQIVLNQLQQRDREHDVR